MLIAVHGDSAYDESRTPARQERTAKVLDANRPRGHWDKVLAKSRGVPARRQE